jgi:hypothetical protein
MFMDISKSSLLHKQLVVQCSLKTIALPFFSQPWQLNGNDVSFFLTNHAVIRGDATPTATVATSERLLAVCQSLSDS